MILLDVDAHTQRMIEMTVYMLSCRLLVKGMQY